MTKRKRRDRDIISSLPISILHRILSFLPCRDSTRTSVLSKQWRFTKKSFPQLIFGELCGMVTFSKGKTGIGKYVDYVDKSLKYFIQHKLAIETLILHLPLEDSDFHPVVDTWLPIALHRGVRDIEFAIIYDYRLPETTFAVNSSLLSGSSKFFCLQKLELHAVILSENIVRDINRNCPNLTNLNLGHIYGLKTLNISKLNKPVNLDIFNCEEINNVLVDSPSLNWFLFERDGPCDRGVFDLTSCCNLRKLELRSIAITDDLFHLHISRFPLLEVLKVSTCDLLRRIRISLQRLKHLNIWCRFPVEVIEIDTPVLSKFEFVLADTNLSKLVSTNTIPGSLELFYNMNLADRSVNSFWFLKIREYFASVPFDGIIFQPLFGPGRDQVIFNIEELREVIIPPLVEVDSLDLTDLAEIRSPRLPTILEGLIWSCHPKTVVMRMKSSANSGCNNDCIKEFCRMVKRKSKCLKAAKVESVGGVTLDIKSIGGIERKQFRHMLKTLSSIQKDTKVVFGLEWDHSVLS